MESGVFNTFIPIPISLNQAATSGFPPSSQRPSRRFQLNSRELDLNFSLYPQIAPTTVQFPTSWKQKPAPPTPSVTSTIRSLLADVLRRPLFTALTHHFPFAIAATPRNSGGPSPFFPSLFSANSYVPSPHCSQTASFSKIRDSRALLASELGAPPSGRGPS